MGTYKRKIQDKMLSHGFHFIIPLLLVVSVLVVFSQVRDFDFIYFDDPTYVRDNPHVNQGLSSESILWAFSSIGYASNWHPLTWLSHMLDVELFGLNFGMHHLTNVMFHAANTLLLFFIFFRITKEKGKSGALAFLFALHPLHVESVAWIAERKDVLSTFFWMLTVGCYIWYVESKSVQRYLLMIAAYCLGLMAKPMLVTLPFVLLLLDFWPLKRLGFSNYPRDESLSQSGPGGLIRNRWGGLISLIQEKVPLIILAGISCIVTIVAQGRGGAMSALESLPIPIRFANAATAYTGYLLKTLWPLNLSVFYPYSRLFSPIHILVSLLILALITILALRLSKQSPFLLTGWLWYVVTLIPVIGIVQVGYQSMADRYTYIPLIGIFIMLVWGSSSLFEKWHKGRYVPICLFIAIAPVLMGLTWIQAGYWKNSITLFSHALAVTDDNFIAHANLAAVLIKNNDIDNAMEHCKEALKINPDYVPALCNMALCLTRNKRYQEAIPLFERALKKNNRDINAHYLLGYNLFEFGKIDAAISQFQKVLQLEPLHAEAKERITRAYTRKREIDETILEMHKALDKNDQDYVLHYKIAGLYRGKGDIKEAVMHYEKALSIRPDFEQALHALAILYGGEEDFDNALLSLQKIVKLRPNDPDAFYNIACIYARQGRVDEAVNSLLAAVRRGFNDTKLIRADPDLENIRQTQVYNKIIMGGVK